MLRRGVLLALSLALLPGLRPPARAVDCGTILGNKVSPCGFESAGEVAAWIDTAGTAAFAPGVGQNGGALDGVSQDFGALGFGWSRNSPCFPVSVGQVYSIGYVAQRLSVFPVECRVGFQYWEDAGCTDPGGGGLVGLQELGDGGYTSILSSTIVPPGRVALSVILSCRGDREFQLRVDNAFAAPVATDACVRNDETACLHAGRFEVRVDWRTADAEGDAQVMEFLGERAENDESVFWWFFNPRNFEMGVKVLKACVPAFGNKYWVFASGLTNQGWTIRVRDTYTDAARTYVNLVDQLSETFADTDAFDCP